MYTVATGNIYRKKMRFLCAPPQFLLGTNSVKSTSLIESAAAFSSQPSQKCLLEKIDVITGEETEHNVLKVCMCILFFLVVLTSLE